MRATLWTAALGLGLSLASTASAQTLTNLNANNNAPPTAPGVSITSYLLNTFSLTNLFSSYSMTARTQTPVTSAIPNPSTPAYLQAFGFQPAHNNPVYNEASPHHCEKNLLDNLGMKTILSPSFRVLTKGK